MATVNKDFRVKHGLVVEGENGTINDSDIITESILTGGTQTNIEVTYDPQTKTVSFVSENGIADSTTDDLTEGTENLYFTDERAVLAQDGLWDLAGAAATAETNANSFTTDAINALDTDDIEEGSTNLYFTAQRAADAAWASATPENGPQTLVRRDIAGAVYLDVYGDLTGSVYANGGTVKQLSEPVDPSDAATKAYVDSVAAGLTWKSAVHLLASEDIELTGNTETLIIDGHEALDSTDNNVYRILLINQETDSENGIYLYTDNGTTYTLVRTSDADAYQELVGASVFVMEGTQYASSSWVQSSHYLTGFAGQNWTQFSGTGTYLAGTNLSLTGNTISLNDEITLSTVNANLNGNVTGNLTGDVTGTVSSLENHDTSDLEEGANLYFTEQRVLDTIDGISPSFEEVDINSIAKQVASSTNLTASTLNVVYSFAKSAYRSAKFIVKVSLGTHTEVSEVLLTLDSTDNIAITEYAVVGTNGSLSTISASINGGNVELIVNPTGTAVAKVFGTLLV